MKNKKSLGQHWLHNRVILDEIADLAAVEGAPVCLEIGPGLGTLTSSLLKRFSKVVAIEYDTDLAHKLPASFPGKNLQVVNEDVLTADLPALAGGEAYVVAGNIPYYITSPIVKKVLELQPLPQKIVLLMQKEVAERIAADVGDYSLLGLRVQNLAAVELGPVVKAAEFTPPPKVDSRVLILTPRGESLVSEGAVQLAARGFASPRKKLAGVLADGQISKDQWQRLLAANQLNPDARAQDLNLFDWQKLLESMKTL